MPTLLEAAKLLGEIRAAADPATVPVQDEGRTLKAFTVEFLRRHEPARRDPRTYGSNAKILPEHFGETVRLGEITVPMILAFRITRIDRDKVKAYSVNRQVACLSAIYSCATKWGTWNGPNPCRSIAPFKEPPARDRVFSVEKVERILSAAAEDPIFYAIVMTALYTGIRKGALLTLDTCWSRVRKKKTEITEGRFHDLRRTYGTAAMERGIGTGMIQRLLSHPQASTTERDLHTSRGALKDLAPLLGPPRKK